MTMTITDVETYLGRVQALEPVLREHADANERERRLVEPVVDALRDAGMYRLFVPEELGGAQLDPLEAGRVVAALAEIDSAVAWNVGIAAASAPAALMFNEIEDAYRANPDAVCAFSTAAPVFATANEGGYEISGELKTMSGAHQAEWFMGLAIVIRDGQPVMDPTGTMPDIHVACLERGAVEILDHWHVSAMRGTGSTDAVVAGAQVATSRVRSIRDFQERARSVPSLRLWPWNGIYLEAVVSLGIARAALRDLKELARTKIAGGGDMEPIQQRPRVQHNLGLATALVDGAEAYMKDAMSQAMDHVASSDERLTNEIKVGCQLSVFMGADASARAVDLVCEAAGTSSARLEHRFERYFRDVHFLARHAQKTAERVTSAGRMLLGMPAGWPSLDLL